MHGIELYYNLRILKCDLFAGLVAQLGHCTRDTEICQSLWLDQVSSLQMISRNFCYRLGNYDSFVTLDVSRVPAICTPRINAPFQVWF